MCVQANASFYLFFFFFVVILWNRLHENLFCSSSSLSQFPGRNGHTGSNVQQISVSVPLFPCVNALTSKNTTSLCIYCVRRWVSSPFHLPFVRLQEVVFGDQWLVRMSRYESEHASERVLVRMPAREEPVDLCEYGCITRTLLS